MSKIIAKDAETELISVHLIFRHGDRTPDDPYPNDPHKSHTYAPYGDGELTKIGYKRMYNNGKFFRERYDSFLGPLYKQNEVHAQSTGMPRTRMSLQLFCAGMFPPANTDLEWNENLNWQPCHFMSLPVTKDPLLLPIGACFQLFIEKLTVYYAPVIFRNKDLFDTLTGFIGKPIRQPLDVTSLYQTLKSQTENGLELPEWTKEYYPDMLRELSNEAWGIMVSTDTLKRMMVGNLLKSLVADWEAKIAGTSSKKMFLYSGHDSTVVGILGACNVWNPSELPEYGITAIFELRKNRKTGEYGVQTYVRNEPDNEPVLLTIPGCQSFCSLDDFKAVLSNSFSTETD